MLGYFDPNGISTVPEMLACIQSLSSFAVTCLNLFHHRFDGGNLKLNSQIDLDVYDVVIVHNSVAYNPNNVTSLDALLTRKFADFEGVKVLFKQDENHLFRLTAEAIGRMRFDIVLTCLPERERTKIYDPDIVGEDVQFVQMLTGYVTPSMRSRFSVASAMEGRPIDIGYRGSIQPLEFGRLCYEKRQIGDEVLKRLEGQNLNLDISSRWEDRFGGEAWFDFLSRCNCILGVESGASIFDIDGDLERRKTAILQRLGPIREDTDYCESFLELLRDLEGNVSYNQVSPRHFEAAACGALQIMYPGEYSGIFHPNRHYVSLARDFSNLQDVIEQGLDPAVRRTIVESAFDEIVMNRDYWIESLAERLDAATLERLEAKGRKRKALFNEVEHAHHGLLLAPHRAHLDPRLKWIAKGGVGDLSIGLMGLKLGRGDGNSPLAGLAGFFGDKPLVAADAQWLTLMSSMVGTNVAGNAALRELFELERALALSDTAVCERYGASTSSKRLADFRWYLQYLLDVTRSLVMPALSMRGLEFVIAADLPTLPTALILKSVFGVKVIYDAHEYWAENDSRAEPFEITFWQAIEQRLTPHADLHQVVSPGLADLLSKETGCRFDSVPNCIPQSEVLQPSPTDRVSIAETLNKKVVTFLFQGIFAPGRGLEEIIHAWPHVSDVAQLVLRGPESEFKDRLVSLASDLGLGSEAVMFMPAVSEDELVAAAAGFDVGLIPYPPSNKNNANCCPNKLSQYLAAGLPLLANNTRFVGSIIADAQCGVITDFGRTDLLIEKIRWITSHDAERKVMAVKAEAYYREKFNWESVSSEMYRKIRNLVCDQPLKQLTVWPTATFRVYMSENRNNVNNVALLRNVNNVALLRNVSSFAAFRYARAVWRRLPESFQERLKPLKQLLMGLGL